MGRLPRLPRPPLPRFAVAWFPRFPELARIEAFRARHDPMAALIPAHLSLVFPFATSLTRLQVETHVRRTCASWPPIPCAFRSVKSEANEFVFLMAGRGAASIAGLHDRLYTRSLRHHLRPEFEYAPHITLARDKDPARVEAALEEARSALRGEFGDTMRAVDLLSVGRDGRIQRLASIPLNAG